MTDLSIDLGNFRINCRVGAIIIQRSSLLVCSLKQAPWCFLPGGRIKAGESSQEAMLRELQEELGTTAKVIRPVAHTENFFSNQETRFHEFCTYFLVEVPDDVALEVTSDAPESFSWVPLEKVENIDLRPSAIKKVVTALPTTFQLLVLRDSDLKTDGAQI